MSKSCIFILLLKKQSYVVVKISMRIFPRGEKYIFCFHYLSKIPISQNAHHMKLFPTRRALISHLICSVNKMRKSFSLFLSLTAERIHGGLHICHPGLSTLSFSEYNFLLHSCPLHCRRTLMPPWLRHTLHSQLCTSCYVRRSAKAESQRIKQRREMDI